MAYNISKQENLDKEHFGYDTLYSVHMEFETQKCYVSMQIDQDEPNKLRVVSDTEGYHWLHFFLSQQTGASKLHDLPFENQAAIIRGLFISQGIAYEGEGKESCFLTFTHAISARDVDKVAQIIHDRFALREKFFKD